MQTESPAPSESAKKVSLACRVLCQCHAETPGPQYYIIVSADKRQIVLGADRCQRAKTARAWCRAWLAIGKCEKEGWQKWQDRLSACSAMSDKVHTGTCIPQFTPSTTLHIHLEWRAAKSSMNSSLRTSLKLGEKNPQANRHTMRCNYCRPGKALKHRELRCPILQEIRLFSHPWHPKTKDGDTELMGLEDTTIEELEAEFNRLQATPAANP